MTRATNAPQSRRRRKKILKAAKGYRCGRSKLLKTATVAVMRSRQQAYKDRKKEKVISEDSGSSGLMQLPERMGFHTANLSWE